MRLRSGTIAGDADRVEDEAKQAADKQTLVDEPTAADGPVLVDKPAAADESALVNDLAVADNPAPVDK